MTASEPKITAVASVSGLTIVANPADLHRDLHIFLEYAGSRSLKRSQNTNRLPKTDLRELARRMSSPTAAAEVKADSRSPWIAFVEFLAYNMKLVSFEAENSYSNEFLKGYRGYYDNYVTVNEKAARNFFARTALEQERAIREALITLPLGPYNELFDPSPVGLLDSFPDYGRDYTSAQRGDFPGARRLLLSLLADLPGGVWFSTASLVAYLKANHRFFLLPEKAFPPRGGGKPARYNDFTESPYSGHWSRDEVADSDPDAFERVEGRFIERFLESLPLLLRYVELAYDPKLDQAAPGDPKARYPQRGLLPAFRVNDRFLHILQGSTPPARVTVQPNFEIMVVSEVFPAEVMAELGPLGEVTAHSAGQAGPSVITLRLKKDRVAAAAAGRPDLDVAALLRRLSGQEPAQNILTELREWTRHAEIFTLYDGFGLLETAGPLPANTLTDLTAAEISPTLRLVRNPEVALRSITGQAVPLTLLFSHPNEGLLVLPDEARTVFATRSRPLQPAPAAQPVTLTRQERILVRLGGPVEAFDALVHALAALGVPVESMGREPAFLLDKAHEARLEQAIQSLAGRFQIQMQW